MKFRPCIDIHNGQVKQIVGGSLVDQGDLARENFVSTQDAAFYAGLYREGGLKGGHIILLNPSSSGYYEETKKQALSALKTYPGGLQVGGGINDENAEEYLRAGASHVIVTSFVFQDGKISYDNLEKMKKAVGREHLVLDLSCRKKEDGYYVVTDRWQKFTDLKLTLKALCKLGESCDEFLIHAVDVEGKAQGIETELVQLLAQYGQIPMTYAGGVGDFEDLRLLRHHGRDRLDVTIGSALDIFGGTMKYEEVIRMCDEKDGGL